MDVVCAEPQTLATLVREVETAIEISVALRRGMLEEARNEIRRIGTTLLRVVADDLPREVVAFGIPDRGGFNLWPRMFMWRRTVAILTNFCRRCLASMLHGVHSAARR